jgi:toxin ParE1/3/4
MNIVWAPLALDRVNEHSEWLSRANPAAAERWIEDVFQAVDRLLDFPMSGPQVKELNRSDLREVIVGAFRIIYRVDSVQVTILALRPTRQASDVEELNGV